MPAATFGFVVLRVRAGFDSRKAGRGRRGGPFPVLIGLLLLAWGAPAVADGYQVRALAYPTLYGPAFETSTLAGTDAAGFGGALVADPPFTEVGDSTLEMTAT